MRGDSEPSQKATEYYVNRKGARMAVIFHFALALACLLSFVFIAPVPAEDLRSSVMSAILISAASFGGFVVFAILGLLFLRSLYSRKPYLVIGERGVCDNASGMVSGAGWIGWSEIADIRLSRYHNLPCVELVPADRDTFLRRFSWLGRIGRDPRLGYPVVGIRGPLLPVEPDVLVEQMRARWLRHRKDAEPG